MNAYTCTLTEYTYNIVTYALVGKKFLMALKA